MSDERCPRFLGNTGGWAAARVGDPREIERRFRAYQERCQALPDLLTPMPAVDVDAILKRVRTLTRSELAQTQSRLESEMKRLEERLQAAGELRSRARGLRIFAEDVGTGAAKAKAGTDSYGSHRPTASGCHPGGNLAATASQVSAAAAEISASGPKVSHIPAARRPAA